MRRGERVELEGGTPRSLSVEGVVIRASLQTNNGSHDHRNERGTHMLIKSPPKGSISAHTRRVSSLSLVACGHNIVIRLRFRDDPLSRSRSAGPGAPALGAEVRLFGSELRAAVAAKLGLGPAAPFFPATDRPPTPSPAMTPPRFTDRTDPIPAPPALPASGTMAEMSPNATSSTPRTPLARARRTASRRLVRGW